MASDIQIAVTDNTVRVPLSISSGATLRSINADSGSPYYVGARAYVTQTESGAVITVIDKDGTTTATVLNGTQGASGEDGNGIVSIEKTATSGLVDTYTITFDDGTTTTFTVTNGEDGEADMDALTNQEIEAMITL